MNEGKQTERLIPTKKEIQLVGSSSDLGSGYTPMVATAVLPNAMIHLTDMEAMNMPEGKQQHFLLQGRL